MMKFPGIFDPRKKLSVKLSDGYLLRQYTFKDRAIKKLKLFKPYLYGRQPEQEGISPNDLSKTYIIVATCQERPP